LPIIDRQPPEIGIEPEFPRHARFDIERGLPGQERREAPAGHVVIVEERLRGGAVKVDAAVEAIEADEDRACFRRTAPSEHGVYPFQRTASQMGRYPEV
jgi:hypothetical protein